MSRRLAPGDGLITVSLDGQRRAVLQDVQFSYPLKLIVPSRRFLAQAQCVYVIGYGGGLVAGDRVRMKVLVKEGTTLVMLTQGSTKVFKTRPGRYLTAPGYASSSSSSSSCSPPSTSQFYRLSVAASALLVLLPAPVTCFSRARYDQHQAVHLADGTSSLVLLDWYTSGRMAMNGGGQEGAPGAGEAWQFERYRSENEVWLAGERIAQDALLLEDEPAPSRSAPSAAAAAAASSASTPTTYRARVAPYSCYATLFLFGPACASLLAHVQAAFSSLTQYKQNRPYSLVWSFSPLKGHPGGGGVARCAGASTEAVREWVTQLLGEGGIEELVGRDLWKTAFS
ncbi:SPOSA6832_00429, partial [Sporobolomyces salmonicolor]